MRAHEAGALHADIGQQGPGWLRTPQDVNALMPQLWPRTARRTDAGHLTVGGVDVRDVARDHGTHSYVLDEADFRARCREFRDAFSAADVYYAGKAFLCKAVVRMVAEEGLYLDVCSGGELAVALAAGMPAEPISSQRLRAWPITSPPHRVGRIRNPPHGAGDQISPMLSGHSGGTLDRPLVPVRVAPPPMSAVSPITRSSGSSTVNGSMWKSGAVESAMKLALSCTWPPELKSR